MEKDKNIKEEIQDISPFLANLKGKEKQPDAPNNYFHFLENSIMEQVALEESPALQTTTGVQVPWWQSRLSAVFAGSFASVLILLAAFFFFKGEEAKSHSFQMADLTDQEIINYLAVNGDFADFETVVLEETETVLPFLSEEEEDLLIQELSAEISDEEIF